MESCNVLVTGGTGFLGRRLVERLLDDNRRVTVLARRPCSKLEERGVSFIRASLDDHAAVQAACAGFKTVYHVAAKVGMGVHYNDFFRTNVLGTRALLEGCRQHGVKHFIYTSSPSVVYNGCDHYGVDESTPLTTECPSPYPLTKAIAEREVLAANSSTLHTVALRPHLIWGVGDPHLVPRVLARARGHRLFIVGAGLNQVDMVHVENAVDAHILAEYALMYENSCAAGRAYFITNNQPVYLWKWINELLRGLGEDPVYQTLSRESAMVIGRICEVLWRVLHLPGEPLMTRFVAEQLAHDHWFNGSAAARDLGYRPRVSMEEGTAELIEHIKAERAAEQLRKAR